MPSALSQGFRDILTMQEIACLQCLTIFSIGQLFLSRRVGRHGRHAEALRCVDFKMQQSLQAG
jgi:hypothetical protein